MLHYATTLHPHLSFLLMERRSKSLQQMFNDAQKIQHNIQGCEQIRDEELEKRTDNSICPLEIFKANDSVENYIPRVERGSGDLASNPYHDKQRAPFEIQIHDSIYIMAI